MSTIITGASGCIGRNLIVYLAKKSKDKIYVVYNSDKTFKGFLKKNGIDKKVIAIKCDLTNPKEVKRIFKKKNKFKKCVFLASNINIARSITDPIYDLKINVIGVINFLANVKIGRLIFMSSTSVYDGLRGKVSPASAVFPVVPYGISKLTAEHYVKFFAKKRKSVSEYIMLRLSGAYGPYSPAKKIYNRIIKDFYFDKKREITLFGDGKNLIDLLSVDEITRAITLGFKSKKVNYTVDLCSGKVVPLKSLIREGAEIFGIKNLKIKHTPFPSTEKYMTYTVSPKGAKKNLKFSNKINYKKGFTKLAKFYESEGI